MKRYDLRHLKDDFYDRMVELIDKGLKVDEVGIFLFEVGDFSSIQKSADVIKEQGHDLMNSLKFNEVDWTVVVKKVSEETKKARVEAIETAKAEAEAAAKAEEEAAKAAAEKAAAEEAAKKAENKDDLTKIVGIGEAYTEKLNSEGIYTFDDVANMTEEQIQLMETKYSFHGDFKESVAHAKTLVETK